jgi:hypothetical protein
MPGSASSATATRLSTACATGPSGSGSSSSPPAPHVLALFRRLSLGATGPGWPRSARNRHRRLARQAPGASPAPTSSASTRTAQPALPPRLLHLRLERRPQLRPAQPRRPHPRRDYRRLVHEADLHYAYFPLCAVILFLGACGKLPRVGPPPKAKAMSAATSTAPSGPSPSPRPSSSSSGRPCPTPRSPSQPATGSS